MYLLDYDFSSLSHETSLQILNTNLYQMCYKNLLLICTSLFYSLLSFDKKSLTLMSLSCISINAFMVWIFMSGVKKKLYPTILSSKYFIVLTFTFTYLPRPRNDLCVQCKAQFSYRKSIDLKLYNEKSIICPLICNAISVTNQVFLPISLSGISILFYGSIFPLLYQSRYILHPPF